MPNPSQFNFAPGTVVSSSQVNSNTYGLWNQHFALIAALNGCSWIPSGALAAVTPGTGISASASSCSANSGAGTTLSVSLSHGDYVDLSATAQTKLGAFTAAVLNSTGNIAAGTASGQQITFAPASVLTGTASSSALGLSGTTAGTVSLYANGVSNSATATNSATGDFTILGKYNGDGSLLTALNASQLTSGTIPNARIVALPMANLAVDPTNAANITTGTLPFARLAFTGNINSTTAAGNNIISWNAVSGNVSMFVNHVNPVQGIFPDCQGLYDAGMLRTLDCSGNEGLTGDLHATNLYGAGANITALNATQLTSGTIPNARIVALPMANLAVDPTNAANITSGTLPNARISGLPMANLAVDPTNASNLASGTVPTPRLPMQWGASSIPNGATTKTVTFASAFSAAPSAVLVTGSFTASSSTSSNYTGTWVVTAASTTSFTVSVTSAPASACTAGGTNCVFNFYWQALP